MSEDEEAIVKEIVVSLVQEDGLRGNCPVRPFVFLVEYLKGFGNFVKEEPCLNLA